MAGQGQELVLKPVKAALSDVAYGDHPADPSPRALDGLSCRLEVAPLAVLSVKCELHDKGLTPSRALFGCVRSCQGVPLGIPSGDGRRRSAKEPCVGRIAKQRRTLWIDDQHRVTQAQENGSQPRLFRLAGLALLLCCVSHFLRFSSPRREIIVTVVQFLDGSLQLLIDSFEFLVA